MVTPLLIIVFGIISYGYMLSFRQAISQAAAEGARAAAVTVAGTSADERARLGKQAVESALSSYGVSCSGAMTCEIDAAASCGTATCVKVKLDYNYKDAPLTPLFPGLGIVLPDHLVYQAAAELS